MLDFDKPKVQFRVRGVTYHLADLTLDDAATMASFDKSDPVQQTVLMKNLLYSKARSDIPSWWLWVRGKRTPEKAIRSLSVPQQIALLKEWMADYRGVVPGESSGSAN